MLLNAWGTATYRSRRERELRGGRSGDVRAVHDAGLGELHKACLCGGIWGTWGTGDTEGTGDGSCQGGDMGTGGTRGMPV